eukprot:306543_1
MTKTWIIMHCILFILSIILLIICLTIPLTASYLSYTIILFCISLDTIITILTCRIGICCKSKFKRLNQIDDIFTFITIVCWILLLFVVIICGISDTASKYTSYNRWEEFIPILIVLLIQVLLCWKLLIRIDSDNLPIIYNKNYNSYHDDIVLSCKSYTHICIPCKWLFLVVCVFLAFTIGIRSIEKSLFINSFNQRNTKILTTEHFGTFEYECRGTTKPQQADIRVISVSALGSIALSFGWYNNLIYNIYGIQQNKSISICDYNRGGFGFTESKKYRDKLIKTDVEHLMEICDILFGKNKSFHLIGHSRGGLMLLQAKMLYNIRVESMVFVDGYTNANKIRYNSTHNKQYAQTQLYFEIASIGASIMSFEITSSFFVGSYEPELSGKYYGFRNFQTQSSAWEEYDLQTGYENTIKLYNNNKANYNFDPAFNIECDEKYDEHIWYSSNNNTLYVKTGHVACLEDKSIANMVFYYNNSGLKAFYDSLFL